MKASRRNTMNQNESDQWPARLRRGAIAVVASAAMAAATVHADPSGNVVLAWQNLPTLAWLTGEAKFLRDTIDGGTLVYIEPNQGARPTGIDLTDPARLKAEDSVRFDAFGSFESVFPFGNQAELAWLRQRRITAALYLSTLNDSNLRMVQAPSLQGLIVLPGTDGFSVARHGMEAPPAQDYRSIDPVNLQELNRVFDVKQVRTKRTHADAQNFLE
jgi:hypothetical protein